MLPEHQELFAQIAVAVVQEREAFARAGSGVSQRWRVVPPPHTGDVVQPAVGDEHVAQAVQVGCDGGGVEAGHLGIKALR